MRSIRTWLANLLRAFAKWVEGDTRDREWQRLAAADEYIAAIKAHRVTYGSTLKDAKETVDAYRVRVQS